MRSPAPCARTASSRWSRWITFCTASAAAHATAMADVGVPVLEEAAARRERLDDAPLRRAPRRSAGSRRPGPWRSSSGRARCLPARARAACRCGPCRTSPRRRSAGCRGGRRSRARGGSSRAPAGPRPSVAPPTGLGDEARSRLSPPSSSIAASSSLREPLAVLLAASRRRAGRGTRSTARRASTSISSGANCSPPPLVAADRERAQRVAVVALAARDEVRALRLADLDEILARELERGLDRLRAAGDEIDVRHAVGCVRDEMVGQLLGDRRGEEARVRVGERGRSARASPRSRPGCPWPRHDTAAPPEASRYSPAARASMMTMPRPLTAHSAGRAASAAGAGPGSCGRPSALRAGRQ